MNEAGKQLWNDAIQRMIDEEQAKAAARNAARNGCLTTVALWLIAVTALIALVIYLMR